MKDVSIGIDLGTSNCAVALGKLPQGRVEHVPIAQVLGVDTIGEQTVLPSALYIPLPGEVEASLAALPWQSNPKVDEVVGAFARERAATMPERVVLSAKSWLCNAQVDRRQAILPWGARDLPHLFSPIEVSQRYLIHLQRVVEAELKRRGIVMDAQRAEVVLTVPASFDEVARALTVEAANAAGFADVVLLEEPLAAFYAWLESVGDAWRDQIKPGDLVLVCDVGGGTADFSLIAVEEQNGNLGLERVSVGEHILLGGDNMDLTLAMVIRQQLEEAGQELDRWQFQSLVQAARGAKERLLGDADITEVPLSVASRGSNLFESTISTTLNRKAVEDVILDGFFPFVRVDDSSQRRKSVGLHEFGLPYAQDPALSRHLAEFLVRSLRNVHSDERLIRLLPEAVAAKDYVRPNKVLFNGGVFKAECLRQRVLEILKVWCAGFEIDQLLGSDLDLAVARGASIYGGIRVRGDALRIRAGSSRSYYLGVASSMPAVPGFIPPVKGVCVIPQGMEEGTDLTLPNREFGLMVGEQAEFRFFSSPERAGDQVGTVVEMAEKQLEETARLTLELPTTAGVGGQVLPVRLRSVMTEMGALELWMEHVESGQRWKLEFNIRNIERQ